LAFRPLRDHDAQLTDDDAGPELLLGDCTLEALARSLKASGGAGALDLDELHVLLKGLGEYKRGGGGDRGRFLALWSGAPWTYTRVGSGGKDRNAVNLRIPRPVVVTCGGLQPQLHALLGDDESGMRPRWLPHLATMPDSIGNLSVSCVAPDWQLLLGHNLLPQRGAARIWRLNPGARATFERYREGWKVKARGIERGSVTGALVKADVHLARVALTFAEAEQPAEGGDVGSELIERAAGIVEFTLNCWRALPEHESLALSRRDETLDGGVTKLAAWLEEHGGTATRRELQRARVAGVRTPDDLDALLRRYEATYPGTLTEQRPERGGLPFVIVRAPTRRPIETVSPTGDTVIRASAIPHARAESGAIATGDSDAGDTAIGDTASAVADRSADGAEAELARLTAKGLA
jgi:hypothetical protein